MGMSMGFEAVFRWVHVLAGVLWVGLLYFFNFMYGPFSGKIDAHTKKAVVLELMPRVLFWFRWGAVWTWATGFLLLGLVYYQNKIAVDTGRAFTAGTFVMIAVTFLAFLPYDFLFRSAPPRNLRIASTAAFVLLGAVVFLFVKVGNFSYRGTLIHTGALFGTIMAFNVWFRIWPAQREIIRAAKEATTPDQSLTARAALRARHNAYLSVPLLWAMIGQHTSYFAGGNLGFTSDYYWIVWLVVILVGWHIVFHLYQRAAKVQGS